MDRADGGKNNELIQVSVMPGDFLYLLVCM